MLSKILIPFNYLVFFPNKLIQFFNQDQIHNLSQFLLVYFLKLYQFLKTKKINLNSHHYHFHYNLMKVFIKVTFLSRAILFHNILKVFLSFPMNLLYNLNNN